MKRTLICTIFLILFIATPALLLSQNFIDPEYVKVEKFDPARDASADIREAIAEAKRSNRRIILDVGGEWCIWCKRLDTLFMRNSDLTDFMFKNYVVVKVNFSKENENETVLSQYPEIQGYPHIFVLEKDGKLLHSQDTGDLESGKGHSRNKVFEFLKKWAPVSTSSQDEFEYKVGEDSYTMKKYFFCLLKKGPNRNQDSVAAKMIQENHLAHLSKLGKQDLISIAGPFDGDNEYRGIIIFNVKTKEEAERLEGEDPGVISGRLAMEILPVWLAKGSKLP
jgi:thioredoxin-related protein/uncharacterized protein YciI